MKKFFLWFAFVALTFVVQSSFLPIIHYEGIGPDLLLLIIGSYSFLNGSRLGCYAGFLIGLFQDIATGTFFGINAFSKLLIGYWCGIFSNRVLQDSFLLPISASVVSTVASYFMMGVIMFLLGYSFNPLIHITTHLVPMLCYNMVFAYPVHVFVHKMVDNSEDKNKGSGTF